MGYARVSLGDAAGKLPHFLTTDHKSHSRKTEGEQASAREKLEIPLFSGRSDGPHRSDFCE